MSNEDIKEIFVEVGGQLDEYDPIIKAVNENLCIIQINYINELKPLSDTLIKQFSTKIKELFPEIYDIQFIYGNLIYRCNRYSMLD